MKFVEKNWVWRKSAKISSLLVCDDPQEGSIHLQNQSFLSCDP